MKELLQIDQGFESYEDENLRYVEDFSMKEFNQQSGLIFVDRKDFDADEVKARKKMSDPKNQSWGILEKEVTDMIQEKNRLINLFKDFYSTNISENPVLKDLPPHKLQYLITELVVRIKRLECVMDTQYNSTEFIEKKTGNRYLMAKGYWIDNNGKRVRKISRSIMNKQDTITELAIKVLKVNHSSIVTLEPARSSGYKPDFVVFDKPNEWWVELKTKNMNDLVKSYIMYETWKVYKSEYELLP
jgi:hypothetical protein